MSHLRALLILLLAASLAWAGEANDMTWDGTVSSTWNDVDNWTPNDGNDAFPNAVDHIARFAGPGANPPVLGDARTVNQLHFSGADVTLSGAGTLTLDGTTPSITVTAGAHTISCPLTLAANLTIQVNAGATLTISGAIGGAGNIAKTGTGTLVLSGNNGVTGTTAVNAGTLRVAHGNALGGGGTTVAASAVLVLSNDVTVANEGLTLNGTLRFDSATGSQWGGTATLAAAGSPSIEVLRGSNTIASTVQMQVNTALPVVLLAGSSLTIADTEVEGTGLISALGGGSLTLDDNTAPGAPTVAIAATTTDTTPQWTWSPAGASAGAAVYRHRLDNPDLSTGTITTTALDYTPAVALSQGTHTLYVQERDAAGNWSASGSDATIIDSLAPTISARITVDSATANGLIDMIEVTLSEAMNPAQLGSWTVEGYDVDTVQWKGGSGNTIVQLLISGNDGPDTGAIPVVRYQAGAMADVAGNALPTEGTGVAASDGARPVITAAIATFGTKILTVQFSEPVVSTAQGSGNLDLSDLEVTPGNSIQSFSDANGLDRAVICTVLNDINAGATVRTAFDQIYDLTGLTMVQTYVAVTQPVAARVTQSAGSWYSGTTWVGGIIPGPGDFVELHHAVELPQNGFETPFIEIRGLTFESGGALSAANNVNSNSYYTILNVTDRLVVANASASVTNVQFYDWPGGDFVFRVNAGTLTLTNTVQGHFVRSVVKQGAGTLAWNSVANGYGGYDLGPTRVEAGLFRLGVANGRPSGYEWSVLSGATLELAVSQTINLLTGQGTVTRAGVATPTLTLQGSAWSGAITGPVTVSTSGVSNTWSGINTFSGSLTLTGGSLTVQGGSAIADTSAVTVAAGATLTVSAAEGIGPLSGAGAVALNSDLTINHGTASATFSGALSGAGRLSITGSTGAQALTGSNGFTGGLTLTSGTLEVASNAALGATSGTLAFAGGRLRLSGHVNLTAAAVQTTADGTGPSAVLAQQGAPAADRPVSVTAADGSIELGAFSLALPAFSTAVGQDLTIIGNGTTAVDPADPALFVVVDAGTAIWAGQLDAGSAFGFLCKRGAGTLAITNAANSWSKRVVRAEQGTLSFGASGALGAVGDWVYILPGATGRLDGVVYAPAPTLYLSGTLGVQGTSSWQGTTWLWTTTPVIDVAAASRLTLDGPVVSLSATGLTKSGAGTLALAQSNTFVLPVAATGGRLEIAADDRLGNAANALTLAGGTLAVTSGFSSARTLTLGAGGGTVEVASGQTLAWNGAIVGGALGKSGAGTLTLAAGNTFTAGTTITAGTVSVANASALGDPGSGVTFAGGTLRATASAVLTGRPVAVGAGGGTIEVTAGTLELPATVSGTGLLAKTGAGILALSGANTLDGAIAVHEGSLSARSDGALGTTTGATSVASGATLELAGDLANAEPLSLAGAGVGGIGALRSTTGTHALAGAITLVQTAVPVALAVDAAADLGLGGALGGAGGWRKLGGGTLTLSAAGGFTGDVAVEAGTLALGADNRLGLAANQVLLDGGSLRATATFATTRTVRIGSGGGTLVPAGFTLTLPGLDTAPGQTLTLTGPGTVGFAIAGSRNLAGVLAGDAALLKSGAGTLVVGNAANTFSGTTTVADGVVQLTGSLPGAIAVDAAGELAGNGSGGATTVQSGGRLSPGGAAAGVLTLASLDLQAGAELAANLGSASDLVAVSGAATIRGLLIMLPGGGFVDGTYTLVNAAGGVTYVEGDMVISPAPVPPPRFSITATSDKLLLTRDGANPQITAITSTSPDGDYITGDSVNVRIVFSEAVNLAGGLELTLNTVPVATITIAPSPSPTSFASEFDGTYTVAAPEESPDLSVDAIAFVGGGAFTDAVGNTVSGALGLPGQNLGALKNIAIVNLPPVVEINGGGAGNTTPTPFAIGSPGSTVAFSSLAGPPADELSVQATDAETPAATDLTWTLLLEPGQGVLERLNGASWDTVTLGSDFLHQQIVDGEVRYRHTASVGGNDALLLQCRDPQGNETPLFLVRFAIAGAGPPVVQNFLDALTVLEPESKPGELMAIDGDVLVLDADSTDFATGDMLVSVLNGGALDQLDLLPDAVTVGNTVHIDGEAIGTVSGRGTNALTFAFTAGATPGSVTTLLKNIGYRYLGSAPTNTVGRALRVRIRDNAAGSYAEATKTVIIDPWNDPPTATAPVIATVPGLARSGTITRSDPEGLGAASITLTRIQDPIRGAITAWDPVAGTFTYRPDFLPAATPGEVVTDSFVVRATDLDFDGLAAERTPSGSDVARTQARSSDITVTINITQAGADGLRFRNPARMTIAPAGNLLYIPDIVAPPGASLAFELIDAPAGPTVDGAGRVIWNGVTVPADGYHRFGLLMTDTVSGQATLLPIMLRVGPGGSG